MISIHMISMYVEMIGHSIDHYAFRESVIGIIYFVGIFSRVFQYSERAAHPGQSL